MIVDTSALMAILRDEPEVDDFIDLIDRAPSCSISAGNWVEIAAVLSQRADHDLAVQAAQLLHELRIVVEPVTPEQAQIGHEAYFRFGKGQHRAKLNFGDCFAYALAKATNRPLLFKGDDFTHTDIVPAI